MATLGKNHLTLESAYGQVKIKRDNNGIPVIKTAEQKALYYGLGWVHACDRIMNMELSRLIAQGRGAECLDRSLLQLDITMRRYNLWGDSLEEAKKLTGRDFELVTAYCDGVNERFRVGPLPFEFKLIKHKPAPWTAADVIATLKLIGMVDLTETQGWMERFIIEMIKQGYSLKMIKEIFPYLTDEPGEQYLEIIRKVRMPEPMVPETIAWAALPRMQCSNNWVVTGRKSASGRALFCGDPHLDSSRLPAIWQEVILKCGDFRFAGATVPGIPGMPMGRTDYLAWSPTYGNMDVVDYFIEDVRDGRYRRGDLYLPFTVREEVFKVRGDKPVTVNYYETVHGTLEEEPAENGYYLCLAWSGARGCGSESVSGMLQAPHLKTAFEALACFQTLDFSAFNWVVADAESNIGYRMSGRNPVRRAGSSGLLPMPGWDDSYDWQGFHDRSTNPSLYNPECSYIITANQDMNNLGTERITSIAMPPYRTRRIKELLEASDSHTIEMMKKMQYDIYAKQAEDYMAIIRPLLPESENGRSLAAWNLEYSSASTAPFLFEKIYSELFALVFGDLNFGRDVTGYLIHETVLMHDYYYNFDRVLLGEDSPWFRGLSREEIFSKAIDKALAVKAEPYGQGRKIMMKNLLLGGRLPRFFGFDYGPLELIGGRTTISISQIFKTGERVATFSPTYRFITDFSENKIHSVLAGGPSDRRFSGFYTSGIKGWLKGIYNELELP